MLQALIYCRVSTEEQAEKGFSLDVQEKLCRDFAERNDYETVGVYRDEGKSGTNLDRPALKDLLERSQQDKTIKAVIVQETDRLARNTKDHLTIRALLQKANVKLISVAQPMLDDSPEGNMIDTILASVNQFQSDINSRKTRKSLQEKFEQGWWPGPALFGYINVPVGESLDGRRARKIVANDPERWHLLQEGFHLYLTGDYSVLAIIDILHEKGLRSRKGGKMPHSVMTYVLQNPFYAGIITWKGQKKIGRHEAMISVDEHERILEILRERNHYANRRRKYAFLLNGFVFCNICGQRYTAEKHPLKKKDYYHCICLRKHSNRGQNVEVEELEEQVKEQFRTVQFSDEFIQRVFIAMQQLYYRQRETSEEQKQVLYNRQKALEAKLDKAEEKLLSGILLDADFARIRDKLNGELQGIHNRIVEVDLQSQSGFDVVREILRLSQDVYVTYAAAADKLKREYLGLFWERFLVQDKKIAKVVPTKLMTVLLENKAVIILPGMLPISALIITILQDKNYMTSLRERLERIRVLQGVDVKAA